MAAARKKKESQRLLYVDSLRGFAVVLFLVQHFPQWLLAQESSALAVNYFASTIARLAAPLFLFIAGLSLHLSARRRISEGQSRTTILLHAARRGVELILLGVLLNVLAFKPLAYVNILTTLGLGLILAAPFLFTPEPAILVPLLLTFTASLVPAYPSLNPLASGEFPPVAWIFLLLLGVLYGRVRRSYSFSEGHWATLLSGFVLLAFLAATFTQVGSIQKSFSVHTSFIPALAALTLAVTLIFNYHYEYKPAKPGIFARFGRSSLEIYLAHYALVHAPARAFGFYQTLNLPASAALLAVFLLAANKLLSGKNH